VLTFGAGVLFFPISYVFGDVLTEVYGYARSRRVIWAGFAGARVRLVHGVRWWWRCRRRPSGSTRTPTRSPSARLADRARLDDRYFCGEFVNSYVLAKMKIATRALALDAHHRLDDLRRGRGLALFYPLAFYGTGIIPDDKLPQVMLAQFVAKVAVEVVFTPVTYCVVGWLKRAEHEDYYDRGHRFTPFSLKV
jgi:hypothetical protein